MLTYHNIKTVCYNVLHHNCLNLSVYLASNSTELHNKLNPEPPSRLVIGAVSAIRLIEAKDDFAS